MRPGGGQLVPSGDFAAYALATDDETVGAGAIATRGFAKSAATHESAELTHMLSTQLPDGPQSVFTVHVGGTVPVTSGQTPRPKPSVFVAGSARKLATAILHASYLLGAVSNASVIEPETSWST